MHHGDTEDSEEEEIEHSLPVLRASVVFSRFYLNIVLSSSGVMCRAMMWLARCSGM